MKKKATKTEVLAERVYETLRNATERVTADDLARAAGCSKQKVYLIIGILRGLMESTTNDTISSRRAVGYRIAGQDEHGDIDDVQKQIDLLMEATKSGERGFAHLRRQAKLLPMIDRALLRDPDQIELLSINIGMQAAMAVVFAYESRLKSIASNVTKRHLLDAKKEAQAPSKSFGLKSFKELLQAARSDDEDDDGFDS